MEEKFLLWSTSALYGNKPQLHPLPFLSPLLNPFGHKLPNAEDFQIKPHSFTSRIHIIQQTPNVTLKLSTPSILAVNHFFYSI
jgi:hypothetical protein